MKIIKGDLILIKDTTFDESIKVEGNIKGHYNLKVNGDINAENIDVLNLIADNITAVDIYARDIDARNITAVDIYARDIDARDIDARNITAVDIYARDIDAKNIIAVEIHVRNIDALVIFCEKVKLENKAKGKIKAKAVIRKRFELEQKEWESD